MDVRQVQTFNQACNCDDAGCRVINMNHYTCGLLLGHALFVSIHVLFWG